MDIQGLRALVRSINFATHGVPASVTPPSELTVEDARILWLTLDTAQVPADAEFRRSESRRGVAVAMQDGPTWHGVPTVPRGTLIETLPVSVPPVIWRVDSVERIEDGHVRVFVVPETL